MTSDEFAAAQLNFARRLRRLIALPMRVKGGDLQVDDVVKSIEKQVDGTEPVTGLVVTRIAQNDRRLRDNMVTMRHVLADIPKEPLFGTKFGSDLQRVRRYELLAALMVCSGFPIELLDGDQWKKYHFAPSSEFFRQREVERLNEQFISCWARRLLCFYGEITNVRVEGMELRDKLADANEGMTTEQLLRQKLGDSSFGNSDEPFEFDL